MFPNGIPANIINLPPADQMGWRPGGETILVKGQFTEDGSAIDAMGNVPEVLVEEDAHVTGPEGVRTILMVLVSADDSASTFTSSTVSTAVFGSVLSASSQFSACSYDKLTLSPASFGTGAEAGTATLGLSQNITGEGINPTGFGSGVEGAITPALIDAYSVTSPAQLADHVMYCVPPGTVSSSGSANWVAYAYSYASGPSFHWLSVYNDDFCLVSVDIMFATPFCANTIHVCLCAMNPFFTLSY